MTLLSAFGTISGYKINLSKSISLEAKKQKNTWSNFPFAMSNSFKYLRINITDDISGLFGKNFYILLKNTEKQLEKWSHLPISLAGRINIRMTILPKFLFLFQCIPILIRKAFFAKIDSIITFIWNKKRPRIKR